MIGQIFLLYSNNYTKFRFIFDKKFVQVYRLTNTKKAIRGNSASQWIALIRASSRDPARTLAVDSLNVSLYPASGPFCVSIYYAIARLAPFIVRGDQGKAVNQLRHCHYTRGLPQPLIALIIFSFPRFTRWLRVMQIATRYISTFNPLKTAINEK